MLGNWEIESRILHHLLYHSNGHCKQINLQTNHKIRAQNLAIRTRKHAWTLEIISDFYTGTSQLINNLEVYSKGSSRNELISFWPFSNPHTYHFNHVSTFRNLPTRLNWTSTILLTKIQSQQKKEGILGNNKVKQCCGCKINLTEDLTAIKLPNIIETSSSNCSQSQKESNTLF